jgi:hypothetical protein
MKRRGFLGSMGLGAYSLVVRVDDASASTTADPPATPPAARDFAAIAPPDASHAAAPSDPNMTRVRLEVDVCVAGGGLAGVCAAVAAARHGAKVVLINDRSRLGGNSSSEVKMHVVGANSHKSRPGWREGGLIEEFRLDDAVNNPQRSWELWDLLLYGKCISEPNLTLLLDTVLFRAHVEDGRITTAFARCDKTEHLYEIVAPLYLDCTGDSRLALEAGAEFRFGREAREEFRESLAPESPDAETLGSSILFTSKQHDQPMPFTPPPWARKVTREMLFKRPTNSWEYGYWWIEWGGHLNTIRDNERIRHELLRIVLGVWDYIKNSGDHPESANWAMDWVGMMTGKRGSRRIVGDHMLTQNDLMGLTDEPYDAVAIGGWPMDDHPPGGFDRTDLPPNTSIRTPIYNIPLRSLYSKNIANLMMAGRNISASHVAFTSTRVMATCAVIGQAAGTAAALCAREKLSPRELVKDRNRLRVFQQTLLRDDQSIVDVTNEDPADLARKARVRASAETADAPASNLLDGHVRDIPKESIHRWSAPLAGGDDTWIELAWEQPQTLREIQITFDTGFHRELTLTSQTNANAGIIRAPQPETVKAYTLLARKGEGDGGDAWTSIAEVANNHQRLVRHALPQPITTSTLRLRINATHGDPLARVFEIRAYA